MNALGTKEYALSGLRLIALLIGLVSVVWGFHFEPDHTWGWLLFFFGLIVSLWVLIHLLLGKVALRARR